MKTIVVLALDGVMDSSLAITTDTLRAVRFLTGKENGLRMLVAGHGKVVTTGGGMRLAADVRFGELEQGKVRADWMVVPGLGLATNAAIDRRFAKADAQAAMRLLRSLPDATCIAASCSAVFLLAQAGLADGRSVTATWWLAQLFRTRHPKIKLDESRMLARDGRLLTAGAAFAQLDLVLAVIADTMGSAAVELCSRYLLIDQRPSQARYMALAHVQHIDPTVVAAERWIDAHLAQPISVSVLAQELAVSPKTLARRVDAAMGLSPVKFIQKRRLMQAVHLIESTGLSIEAIAARVGYQDGTALRKLVKREFGVTPGAMRSRDVG